MEGSPTTSSETSSLFTAPTTPRAASRYTIGDIGPGWPAFKWFVSSCAQPVAANDKAGADQPAPASFVVFSNPARSQYW